MTTETKHTPGPWEHIPGSYFDRIQAYDGTVIVDAEIDVANARLIAAAPELMGALVKLRDRLTDLANHCHNAKGPFVTGDMRAIGAELVDIWTDADARDAIAKAEGRQ